MRNLIYKILREGEDEFGWAREIISQPFMALKGRPWHMDITAADFIVVQEWLFTQGFVWAHGHAKIISLSDVENNVSNLASIFGGDVKKGRFTYGDRRWTYDNSIETALKDNLERPMHLIWDSHLGYPTMIN